MGKANRENGKLAAIGETNSAGRSRRRVLALMLGACRLLSAAPPPPPGGAAANAAPVRLAISESLVFGVNLNDARAAMLIWLRQMEAELRLPIEINPNVFETTAEILRRARAGLFDAVALNIIEYRRVADVLDPNWIINESAGAEAYMLLVKRGGGIQKPGDLRGRRLLMLTGAKMCVAYPWLSTVLDAAHLGQTDQFFSSVVEDSKAARVVLPVFFGQADACVTSKRSFDLMCELNPQVARDLTAIAASGSMVVTFYTFHKNYSGPERDRFAHVYSNLSGTVSGRQLATLFQFSSLSIGDATRLEPALAVLDQAERARTRKEGRGQ
jgi:phosphonate transport system substrate-binding protein